jgi:hypothetical protein
MYLMHAGNALGVGGADYFMAYARTIHTSHNTFCIQKCLVLSESA